MAASLIFARDDNDFTASVRLSGENARRSRISTGAVLWFRPSVIIDMLSSEWLTVKFWPPE